MTGYPLSVTAWANKDWIVSRETDLAGCLKATSEPILANKRQLKEEKQADAVQETYNKKKQ
ncbi:MAG: hypothetical protein WBD34_00745 [Burkholderiaceae bacterium]